MVPYTIAYRQNLIGYLVGTHELEHGARLRLYRFNAENAILRNNANRNFD